MGESRMISVLVLAKNEEINIEHCLACLQWSDDIARLYWPF